MIKKLVALLLACVVLSSALGITLYMYSELGKKYTKSQSEYNTLLNEHELLEASYNALESTYNTLNDTHHNLVDDYSRLNQKSQILIIQYDELNASYKILALNYTQLSSNYTSLQQDYTVLNTQYASLFGDYNTLSDAFNKPLAYEQTPSTSQLEEWLATDKTNEIQYTNPEFICGDFSAMLSLHAKMNHWDLGLVGVFGYNQSYEPFNHAFNAIITQEGLVYVEPQIDGVWWYQNHGAMSEGLWWEFPGVGYVYVEQYVVILNYD